MNFVVSTYQRNLQATEARLARAEQESIDLRIQMQQLLNLATRGGPQDGNACSTKPLLDVADLNHFGQMCKDNLPSKGWRLSCN